MLKNYLKIAFKVFLRRKFFTFISLFGISLTLVVLMVVASFFDHFFGPFPPEVKQDRTLFVFGIHLEYPPEQEHMGTDSQDLSLYFVDHFIRPLDHVEKVSVREEFAHSVTHYNERGDKVDSWLKHTDAAFWDILEFEFLEGSPFLEREVEEADRVAVINEATRRELFGDERAVGRIVKVDKQRLRVVGVVDHYRYEGPLAHEELFLYRRLRWDRGASEQSLPTSFLIRLQPGTPRSFEKRMRKALLPVARSWNLEVETLESRRGRSLGERIKFLRLGGRIAGFMLAMVGLGLVGVLWQNVTQRTREIGVRRASGATRGQVCAQFVGEVMVVATFAAVLGGMLIVQFAFFDLFPSVAPEVYTAGLLCAAGILYLLVSVAALYPGWLATRVQPAAALHRE